MTKLFNPEHRHQLESDSRKASIHPSSVTTLMNIQHADTVLDIGAGTGYFALPISGRLTPPGKIIALDLSDIMLSELQKKMLQESQQAHIVQADAAHLPLPVQTADKVLLAHILHEFPKARETLTEIHRVLRPKGELTVVEWHKVETEQGPPLRHRLSPDDVEMLTAGLFRRIRCEEVGTLQYGIVLTRE